MSPMLPDGTIVDVMSACSNCKRLRSAEGTIFDGVQRKCDAFPEGIPEDIWLGQHPHDRPIGSEVGGLVFAPIDAELGNPAKQ